MPTTPPVISPIPEFPVIGDAAYNNKAFAWATALGTVAAPQINDVADNVHDNAVEAETFAAQAAGAAAAAGATAWVSGATYAIGDARFSLVNFQNYRRKTMGAGTTDPSLDAANWERLVVGDPILTPKSSLTQAITTDLTLTSASPQALRLSTSVTGVCLRLPNATTLAVGTQYVVQNTGAQPIGLRNAALVLVGVVEGAGLATLVLTDNSTNAGGWALSGDLLPGLITADMTFSTTFGLRPINAHVNMNDNESVHFVPLAAGGFAAILVNSLNRTISTPLTVDAGALSVSFDYPVHAAFKINSTDLIVFWSGSGVSHARVLRLSSGTLSAGTTANAAAHFFSANTYAENSVGPPCIVALSPSLYYAAGSQGGTALFSTAIAVDGLTATIGARLNTTCPAYGYWPTVYRWDATTALVLFRGGDGGAGPPYYYQCAYAVSVGGTGGVVCTAGTQLVLGGTGHNSNVPSASCQLTTGAVVIATNANTTKIDCEQLTVSGLTIVRGPAFTVETGTATNPSADYGQIFNTNRGRSRFATALTPLSGGRALLHYAVGGNSRSVVLVASGNTLTAPGGILYYGFASDLSSLTFGSFFPASETEFLAIKRATEVATSNARTRVFVPHKIAGNTVSTGIVLPDTFLPVSDNDPGLEDMGVKIGADYLYMRNNDAGRHAAVSVLRCDGDRVVYRGPIDIPISSMSGINAGFNAVGWGKPNLGNGTLLFTNTEGQTGSARLMRAIRLEVAA